MIRRFLVALYSNNIFTSKYDHMSFQHWLLNPTKKLHISTPVAKISSSLDNKVCDSVVVDSNSTNL